MSEDKRRRSPNWLPSEKLSLLDLVEKRSSIIENKKIDGITMKRKLAEWKIIAELYNSNTSHVYRSAENLKSQWENMKKNAKKEESKNRMHQIQTGGGPAICTKEDPIHSKIIHIIKTSALELSKSFDNVVETCENAAIQTQIPDEQVILLYTNDQDMELENLTCFTPPIIETNSKNERLQDSQDWDDYTPKMLKTSDSAPLHLDRDMQDEHSPKLGISRNRRKYKALEKLHEKKIEAIEYQMSVAEMEALRLAESQELDIQIKKEQLKQEKIKTHLLLLDLRLKKKITKPLFL